MKKNWSKSMLNFIWTCLVFRKVLVFSQKFHCICISTWVVIFLNFVRRVSNLRKKHVSYISYSKKPHACNKLQNERKLTGLHKNFIAYIKYLEYTEHTHTHVCVSSLKIVGNTQAAG